MDPMPIALWLWLPFLHQRQFLIRTYINSNALQRWSERGTSFHSEHCHVDINVLFVGMQLMAECPLQQCEISYFRFTELFASGSAPEPVVEEGDWIELYCVCWTSCFFGVVVLEFFACGQRWDYIVGC
jgi:hypothetical protein